MNNRNKTIMKNIRISEVIFRRFGNFINSFILFRNIMELKFKDIINSDRKLRKEISIIEEEHSAYFWNSKKNMSVRNVKNMFMNIISPKLRIFVTARRTESGFTGKRKFVSNRTVRAFERNKAFG